MKKSFAVALGGIITALSVIFIMLGNIPMGEYIGPTFAGMFTAWAVIELGMGRSLGIYAATSMLAFLLSFNKEPVILYILFFGYFPVLKAFLQLKLKFKALRWVVKFVVFNLAMVAAYLLLIYVFGMPLEEMQGLGKYTVFVLLGGGNVLMVVVDFCIEKLSALYRLKWQKRIHEAFKL